MAHNQPFALRRSMLLLQLLLGCTALFVVVSAEDGGKAALSAYADYDYASAESCLRISRVDSCGIFGLAAGSWFDTSMSCCSAADRHYEGEGIGFDLSLLSSIGKCTWRYEIDILVYQGLLDYIAVEGVTRKIGFYSVQCDLGKGAEECGEGLCEGVLESSGPLIAVGNAAVQWPIPNLVYDNTDIGALGGDCFNLTLLGEGGLIFPRSFKLGEQDVQLPNPAALFGKGLNGAKLRAGKQGKTKARAEYARDGDAGTYVPGLALVVQGPVHITSRAGHTKYEDGFLQGTVQAAPYDDTPITPAAGQYRASTYDIKIKLTKEPEYNYYKQQ